MMDSPAPLLTSAEAAAWLGICTKTLHRLRRDGAIRYVAVTDRKVMFRPDDLGSFVEERSRRAEPSRPIASARVVAFTSLAAGRR